MVKMVPMSQGPYRSHPETVTRWEKDPEVFFCWSMWLAFMALGIPSFIWADAQPLAMFPGFAVFLLFSWIRDGVIKPPFRRVRKFR